jgi:hypothetical protein
MFRKPNTVLPIALLLGIVSAAPALAQTGSHHAAKPHRQVRVSPVNSFAMQPSQGRLPGETRALPFTQDPASPKGW